ncbi:hypothetical protein HXX76_009077 [Chlamydomonas incerta]|uniref:Fatty acid hydroxylase domain-containing protein n=1 Tax=Chlamydomonas incerta TaxID=51695 RepID=A0A835T5P3_CHLIN|nr:hypothetical protein HXX76_009077 [Chlamydomonas incerta]|eukprot:KAG2432155.1 hypothetical protein HXX76_009077 [Chlamydomonas incerta]
MLAAACFCPALAAAATAWVQASLGPALLQIGGVALTVHAAQGVAAVALHVVLLAAYCGAWAFKDLCFPHAWAPYKVQPGRHVDGRTYRSYAARAVPNIAIACGVLYGTVAHLLPWRRSLGFCAPEGLEACWPAYALAVLLSTTFGELVYLAAHRLQHDLPPLRGLHAVHHRVPAPVAISVYTVHPFDLVLQALTPPVLITLLVGPPACYLLGIAAVVALASPTLHCGYAFPGARVVAAHDRHHSEGQEVGWDEMSIPTRTLLSAVSSAAGWLA